MKPGKEGGSLFWGKTLQRHARLSLSWETVEKLGEASNHPRIEAKTS